nr:ABC transporter permease subunit [uncultured Shuttleworthia sp.]
MLELIKLEWIKLCRKRLTIAVTLFCVFVTSIIFCLPFLQYQIWDANGTMLTRGEAVSYRKKTYDEILNGSLTEERITDAMREYKNKYSDAANLMTQRGGETSFTDEVYYRYFAPRQSYLNMIGNAYSNNEYGAANILSVNLENGAEFYETRQETIAERIKNNEDLSDDEKTYWREKSLSLAFPFAYGYALGWASFGETADMLIICIVGICIVLAPIFAGEYQSGADAVILSTRYGKNKIISAKIFVAFLFGTIVFAVNAVIALLLPLLTFGAEGGALPVQIAYISSPYNLTFAQADLLIILIAYIVLVGLIAITLLFSAKMKSAFAVLILDVLIIFIPMFFSLSKTNAWLPAMATSGLSRYSYFISYRLGHFIVDIFCMIVIAYAIITVLSLAFARMLFRKHQV